MHVNLKCRKMKRVIWKWYTRQETHRIIAGYVIVGVIKKVNCRNASAVHPMSFSFGLSCLPLGLFPKVAGI
jgi:hypothetical protein